MIALAPGPIVEDRQLVRRLRQGDSTAFEALILEHHPAMVRTARAYVAGADAAEEVALDAWVVVLAELEEADPFVPLRVYVLQSLLHLARTRQAVPTGIVRSTATAMDEDFLPADHPSLPGWWARHPIAFDAEEPIFRERAESRIAWALEQLPPEPCVVFGLRDVEGWTAADVCSAMGITEAHQRRLLHRSRSWVRSALCTTSRGGRTAPRRTARAPASLVARVRS
jgi:RNA polymerase sigma-70 factor, ECF subfamily